MGPFGSLGSLGPEALRAGESGKNKERHNGVARMLRCDLAPLKGRGGCAATRSRITFGLNFGTDFPILSKRAQIVQILRFPTVSVV